ncbi:MAG: toxin-antitoxin system, antitoxin component [Desulfuromonadales bacterium]|nr:toxin-antitoxin system, antitoxin component [Desulfuromonadales bacterium]
MPTKNPRINVVCEQPLYFELSSIAASEGASLSSVAHDLIKEALELREDRALTALADSRAETFDRTTALSLDQVFGE